ncbi:hypothetical protein [Streptomyces alboniger]|uniref:hypothetical protein n=1 Tax=Streptomyces alboniger TaxID=132473 RepID=UPI00123E333D|nr:hypothetical protein [Streptomyces alboniger]
MTEAYSAGRRATVTEIGALSDEARADAPVGEHADHVQLVVVQEVRLVDLDRGVRQCSWASAASAACA